MSRQTQRKLAMASLRLVAVLAIVAVAALVTNVVVTRAGDEPTKSKAQSDHDKEMAEWIAANQLSPMHEKLKMFVGEWKCVNTMYPGPGAPPQVSKAESEIELILDGRYMRQDYKGSFEAPGPDGKMTTYHFTGEGTMCYDTMKKEFTSMWIDSMSTGIYTEQGHWDDSAKQFVFHGQMPDPSGKMVKSRTTLKFEGKDKFVMTMMRETAPGKYVKGMTIEYTRDD